MSNIKRIIVLILATVFGVTLIPATEAQADNNLIAWKNDKVYVVDYTSSVWPVAQVAEVIDNNSPLDLVHVSKCPRGAQCIYVRETNLPEGSAARYYSAWSNYNIQYANVYLDSDWRRQTYKRRQAAICHELLHAVGIQQHSKTTGSCLYWRVDISSNKPSAEDYRLLNRMY